MMGLTAQAIAVHYERVMCRLTRAGEDFEALRKRRGARRVH
jgi:hypothetical protein